MILSNTIHNFVTWQMIPSTLIVNSVIVNNFVNVVGSFIS